MDITPIVVQMRRQDLNHRSSLRHILEDDSRFVEMAQAILDNISSSITNATPLTASCRTVATRLLDLLQVEHSELTDYAILTIGLSCHHWMAEAGLIDVEKQVVATSTRAYEQWFITSLSKELTDYSLSFAVSTTMPSVLNGHSEWVRPEMWKDGRRIPMVKKAKRYGLLGDYTYESMPSVYDCLNRLGRQQFRVNKSILSLTEERGEQPFIFTPSSVSEETRRDALRSLNDISRKSKFIEEIRFEEMNKWLLDEAEVEDEEIATRISKKRASEKSSDYYDTNAEPHLKVISDWSKRMDFERTTQLAHEWADGVINYIYNQCTRGRIYTVQNYLTPLGSDYAKSLLVFAEKQQVSGYDLCIHIANCFGKDKLFFEDRVKWVNDNSEKLQAIGRNSLMASEFIKEFGLEDELKTRWQGIAACQVYVSYCSYVIDNKGETGFETDLIIGLDSTASGTQILTMLGRDDRVAPFVNVSRSTGGVGDFYSYLAKYLQPKLEKHRGESETLDVILDDYSKFARKLAKRNSMTFSYSGTKFGFGIQHWQDRHSYGKEGSDLTRSDCRVIGNEMFDVCLENIRGGAEIMEWLRDGINHHKGGAIISWTLPDGFKAFQVCDKGKQNKLEGYVGSRKVKLNYYIFTDKAKVSEHKNGISPNFVHSLDAYLLRTIVNTMPAEAPISTIHDQFSTSSYYIEDLQRVAKDAYKLVASRDEAERMAEEAFGIHRDLPIVGDWTIDDIEEAEFIIC